MVGLPGETKTDLENTINFINDHKIQGIKIHSTYILKNTKLEKMYLEGKYKPISYEEYMDSLVYILTHIPENIVIHRISGDPPKDLLVAPIWSLHKKLILNGVDKILKENNLYQGIFYRR